MPFLPTRAARIIAGLSRLRGGKIAWWQLLLPPQVLAMNLDSTSARLLIWMFLHSSGTSPVPPALTEPPPPPLPPPPLPPVSQTPGTLSQLISPGEQANQPPAVTAINPTTNPTPATLDVRLPARRELELP